MRTPMFCVHTLSGTPMMIRIGEDKVLLSKKPVVVVIRGKRYEVRESRKEIEAFTREA